MAGKPSGRTAAVNQEVIATRLGVSIATVSMALRGSPLVAEGTRREVRAMAEQLGYTLRERRPHRAKQEQRPARQIDFVGRYEATNNFYMEVLAGAEEEGQQQELALRYSRIDELNPTTLKQFRASDGLLLVGSIPAATVLQLRELRRPLVLVDNNLPHLGLDRVLTENVGSLYRAVMRLHAAGHRRIAFLSGDSAPSFQERLTGYRSAMAAMGLQPLELPCPGMDAAGIEHHVMTWLQNAPSPPCTALIGYNDTTAISAIHAILNVGLRVPNDISVVGFDDVAEATIVRPSLTTCHVYRRELGKASVLALLKRIREPNTIPRALTLDTTFVERASFSPSTERHDQD